MKKYILFNILLWMFRFSSGTGTTSINVTSVNTSWKHLGCDTICSIMHGFNLCDPLVAASFWVPQYHTGLKFFQGVLFLLSCLLWNDISLLLHLLFVLKMTWASASKGTFPFNTVKYFWIPKLLHCCLVLLAQGVTMESSLIHYTSEFPVC